MLRAQEVAMRQRIPIVYLVDSAGVNLPYQGRVFPVSTAPPNLLLQLDHAPLPARAADQRGDGLRRRGAYLPALSDVIYMVEAPPSWAAGPTGEGATGQTIDAESLGGAVTHTG